MHGASYRRAAPLSALEIRAISDIVLCRTPHFGGRVEQCDTCGHERQTWNSCRNRNCPKCGTITKEEWIEARKAEMLPVPYFHIVFTLPHELNRLVRHNRVLLYDLLFQAASQTLLKFGKERLKGKLGIISLLHTWTQLLETHVHLHCLVPQGALSFNGKRWHRPISDRWLFDVRELSEEFRKRFIRRLKRAFRAGKLHFSGRCRDLADADAFDALIEELEAKDWVVYSKRPFKGPEAAIEYLARYTHRVAISNHRILNVDRESVTFSYRDRKDDDQVKEKGLPAHQFIERFLSHVVPWNYYRIRYFGIYANRFKARELRLAMLALGVFPEIVKPEEKTLEQWMLVFTGEDLAQCPVCPEGTMLTVRILERLRPRRFWSPAVIDTS